MALKGLVELCEDENQFLQCLEGTGRFEKLLKAVIQTINMIDEAAIGISYHLQLESVQLIIMVSKYITSLNLKLGAGLFLKVTWPFPTTLISNL